MEIDECERILEIGQTCIECGACVSRCEVLEDNKCRSIGAMVRSLAGTSKLATNAEIAHKAQEDPQNILGIRRCSMCGYCTLTCPVSIDAQTTVASLRELLSLAGVTDEKGFESTQVDKEWHIFSVYRAVYGITYNDLPQLEHAREKGIDTLFFPGCTLASYAPDLTRSVYEDLANAGIPAVISDACCGIPLKSPGFGERNRSYKTALAKRIENAGIKRVICACPGCQKELMGASKTMQDIEFIPLPQVFAEEGKRIKPAKLQSLIEAQGMPGTQAQDITLTLFDSCYDREGAYSSSLKVLLSNETRIDMPHCGADALCCGAGGSVSLVDPALSERRAQKVFDEGHKADIIVTNCPTCAYTLAYHQRQKGSIEGRVSDPAVCNYLDLLGDEGFDWDTIFNQLEGMWTGEYGAWVVQQLT